MESNSFVGQGNENRESPKNAEEIPAGEGLLSENSILAAVIGAALFLVLALVGTLLLRFSPFSLTHARGSEREFIARVCISFVIYGCVVGFVFYHLWRSSRRKKMIKWMLVLGGAGALVGAALGSLLSLSPPYSLFRAPNGRIMFAIQSTVSFIVIPASLAALFTSNKRRAILKSLFLPIALGLILRVLFLTFAPVKITEMFNQFAGISEQLAGRSFYGSHYERVAPWLILNYVDSPSGANAGPVFVVGIVLAVVRRFKTQKKLESL